MANTTPITTPLTQESIQNALAYLSQKFPQYAGSINQYQNDIVQNMLNNTTPAAGSAILSIPKATSSLNLNSNAVVNLSIDSLSPCELAIANVALDVIFLILTIADLGAARDLVSTNMFASMLGKDTLTGFQTIIHEIGDASGLEKAAKIFDFFGQLYKAGGVDIIIDAWENSDISTWDWITTGVEVVAQIVAWIATDGIALIAQIVIALVDATELIVDVNSAINTCGTINIPTTTTFTPLGTYINSSSSVQVILAAQLQLPREIIQTSNANPLMQSQVVIQPPVSATYDISNLSVTTGFDNVNGELVISANACPAPACFIPNGSYLQTSNTNNVTLKAICLTIQGALVESSLDITNLSLSQTISNINGVLTIDNN